MAERLQAFKNALHTSIERLWLCHRGYLHGKRTLGLQFGFPTVGEYITKD